MLLIQLISLFGGNKTSRIMRSKSNLQWSPRHSRGSQQCWHWSFGRASVWSTVACQADSSAPLGAPRWFCDPWLLQLLGQRLFPFAASPVSHLETIKIKIKTLLFFWTALMGYVFPVPLWTLPWTSRFSFPVVVCELSYHTCVNSVKVWNCVGLCALNRIHTHARIRVDIICMRKYENCAWKQT